MDTVAFPASGYEVTTDLTDERIEQIKDILLLSAEGKVFVTTEEKAEFVDRWLSYYLDFERKNVYVAVNKNGSVAGYLTGCTDTLSATRVLSAKIKSFEVFSDHFEEFDCHLHINCHPDFRGQGLGSQLVNAFLSTIQNAHSGIHIVTSPQAANVSFYQQHGFCHCVERSWNGIDLLLMGRRFDSNP